MSSCDVFISYKRGDAAIVEPLVRKLKELGLSFWLDTRLEAGPSFDEQIASKLRAARAVLVCWTPDAIASQWVRGEAAMANESGKLVACFLKPTKLVPPFNLIQTENLADWSGEDDHAGWAKTMARIASLSDNVAMVDWAALMSQGDPKSLRAWAMRQPPGPLRSTTRFWISELDGTTVVIPDAALAAKRQKTLGGRWKRLRWWQKGATLLGIAALMAGAMFTWAVVTNKSTMTEYDVLIVGTSNVYEGAQVRFNGIDVGSITSIRLDRNDPNNVVARILVDADTPVKTDSLAQQRVDKSSGAAFMLIFPGSPESPRLVSSELGRPPQIPTSMTAQDELEQSQQDLLSVQGDLVSVQRDFYRLMIEKLEKEKLDAADKKSPVATEGR